MASTQRTPALSDEQLELLRRASREGYFKVPRTTTLNDLAASQGISDREASERLREGLDVLLTETVTDVSE